MTDKYRKAEIYRAWQVNRAEPVPEWIKDKIGNLPDTVPEGRWMVMQPGGMLSQWEAEVFASVFVPVTE